MSSASSQNIWLTVQDTDTADFAALFSATSQWSQVKSSLTAFKIVHASVAAMTVAELAQLMVDVASLDVPLIMEVGVLPQSGTGGAGYLVEGFNGGFAGLVEKLEEAQAYAASVLHESVPALAYISMDEPLYYGHDSTETTVDSNGVTGYAPQYSIAKVAAEVAASLKEAQKYDATLQFGDEEPVPAVGPTELKTWIADYKAATGENLAYFQADIQWGKSDWLTVLEQDSAVLAAAGIPLDIFIDGDASATSATQWADEALNNLIAVYLDPKITYSSLDVQSWQANGATSALDGNDTDTTSGTLTNTAYDVAEVAVVNALYQSAYGRAGDSYELYYATKAVTTGVMPQATLAATLATLAPYAAALAASVAAGLALPDAADLQAGVAAATAAANSPVTLAASLAAALGETLDTTAYFLVPDLGSATIDLTDIGDASDIGSIYLYGAADGSAAARTLILPQGVVAVIDLLAPSGSSLGAATLSGGSTTDFVYLASGEITYAVGSALEQIIDATGTGHSVIEATLADAGVLVQGANGTVATLQIAAAGTIILNKNDASITVKLAAGANSVTLGHGAAITVVGTSGTDLLIIGATTQTVIAGSGTETIEATSALAGAAVLGYKATATTLDITTSGSATLSDADHDLTVRLAAGASYLSLGSGANITVYENSASDWLTLGNASQTVIAGSGTDLISATAAVASATIEGSSSGSTTLTITTTGSVTPSNADDDLTVRLSAGTNSLSLGSGTFITAVGGSSGSDTITAGNIDQTLEAMGATDRLVGFTGGGDVFSGTFGHLNGDTLVNFTAGDTIDVTNLASSGAAISYAANVLTLSNGGHTTHITLAGSYSAANFSLGSDGSGGTLVHYVG